jgi:hypothetical protein
MFSLVAARDVAWQHAKLLWRLRDNKPLRDGYLDVLARMTELTARAILA